jgi:Cu2+-exporting ATPase
VGFGGTDALRDRVAALEAQSSHLIAKAMESSAPRSVIERMHVADVREVAGAGILGTVDGHRIMVGHERFLAGEGVEVAVAWRERVDAAAARGETPVLVADDGSVVCLASFGDPLRGDTGQAVNALRRMGMSLGILSGDHPRVVRHVAEALGIDASEAFGGVSPEDKLARVEASMRAGNHVAMIGDGVNDAGALAAARVGIAVRGGAEVSLATADVFLTRPGLRPAVELIRGCRVTMRVVYRNLAISLVYNAVGATLALAGFIDPLAAAVLMPLSSLSVVLSSALSRPFPRRHRREPPLQPLAAEKGHVPA